MRLRNRSSLVGIYHVQAAGVGKRAKGKVVSDCAFGMGRLT
jgi:hypothetical protein